MPDGPVAAARGLGVWLTTAGPARARGEVSLAIVSDRRMRTLNRAFRGQDQPTDVLSFPTTQDTSDPAAKNRRAQAAARRVWTDASAAYSPLGDIVIALGIAERQAREAGHSLRAELRILALHGLLHLLGHDHDQDRGEMARLEQRLRRKAGLPGSLTERYPLPNRPGLRHRDGTAPRRGPRQ